LGIRIFVEVGGVTIACATIGLRIMAAIAEHNDLFFMKITFYLA
jgi:hypothetical protein